MRLLLPLARPLPLCFFALVLSPAPGRSTEAEPARYAGVEVGAKGVKGTVVAINRQAAGNPVIVEMSKSSNPTLGLLKDGDFRPGAVGEAANDVAAFVDLFKTTHKVPDNHIHVVGSSSVAAVPSRDKLAAAVREKTGLTMTFLDVAQEARLTIDGLALQQERLRAMVVDVGSGNTKGGYYSGPDRLETFAVSYGTVSFTTAVKAAAGNAGFAETAARLRDELLVPPLKAQAEKAPGLRNQPRVYLTGGVVWALVTLVRPQDVDSLLVPVTLSDVSAFRRLVATSPGRFPEAKSVPDDGAGRSARAAAEVGRVRDVFTPDNLVAGGELLQALFDTLALGDRPTVFARNGMVAWILAYVTPEDLRASLRVEVIKKPGMSPGSEGPTTAPAPAPLASGQGVAPGPYFASVQVYSGTPAVATSQVVVGALDPSVFACQSPQPAGVTVPHYPPPRAARPAVRPPLTRPPASPPLLGCGRRSRCP